MSEDLPEEISRLDRELDDFEAKMGKEKVHNCEFPVHRCYCAGEDEEVCKTLVRRAQPVKDPTPRRKQKSPERPRTQRPIRKDSASVLKTDISPRKKPKEVYDVENARVTVEVNREKSHSPPIRLDKRNTQKDDVRDDCSEGRDKSKKKRWAEILKEQNAIGKRRLSNKGTQADENTNRDVIQQHNCPFTVEATSILNELKKKSSINEKHELQFLLSDLEKIVKKLEKRIPTKSKDTHQRREEDFNKHIEKSYHNLEASCKQLEESCMRLKGERDTLKEELLKKNTELQKALLREIEFKNKLNEANNSAEAMSQKIEKYSDSMRELTNKFSQLQEETKELGKLQRQVFEMSSELKTASQERESLRTELELIKLERDKMKVLLNLKDQELAQLKNDVLLVGDNVTGQAKVDFPQNELTDVNTTGGSKASRFFCSSPNTTSSEDSPLTKSWQKLSCIAPSGGGDNRTVMPVRKEIKTKKKTREKKPEELSHVVTQVFSLHQTSPERLSSLKNELKELFAEMKHQAELAVDQEDMTSTSEIFKLTHGSSWTQLSDTSHSHSISADSSDVS
ncbi:centromere-associated protein E-like isoform X2 [Cimex lectularius]|uniref:Uncharacterized protein n=1 Tax=Cimex lectularius TaxID=79782 RepID=A0A8I6R9V5_CIMLE|nr:centromere-associated protein E-like isoform X2 [Cimex lectularius]